MMKKPKNINFEDRKYNKLSLTLYDTRECDGQVYESRVAFDGVMVIEQENRENFITEFEELLKKYKI